MKRVLIVLGVAFLALLTLQAGILYLWPDEAPPDLSDLAIVREPLADEDNAYTWFMAAAVSVTGHVDRSELKDVIRGGTNEPARVRVLLESCADTMSLTERGLACGRYQGPIVTNAAMWRDQEWWPPVSGYIDIARLMELECREARATGDLDRAAAACAKMLGFGRLLSEASDMLVSHLVGNAVLSMAFQETVALGRDPRITAVHLSRLRHGVEGCAGLEQGLARCLRGEFWYGYHATRGMAAAPGSLNDLHDPRVRFLGRLPTRQLPPYLYLPNRTAQQQAELCRQMQREVVRPLSASTAGALQPVVESEADPLRLLLRPNMVGRLLSGMLATTYDELHMTHCRIRAARDGTCLLLACKSFEAAHGRLPSTLTELLPTHLAAVPGDPYDGQPYRYDRERRLVYAVGKNLVDDGGSTNLPPGRVRDRDRLDVVFRFDSE